jgi:hypothetical protein
MMHWREVLAWEVVQCRLGYCAVHHLFYSGWNYEQMKLLNRGICPKCEGPLAKEVKAWEVQDTHPQDEVDEPLPEGVRWKANPDFAQHEIERDPNTPVAAFTGTFPDPEHPRVLLSPMTLTAGAFIQDGDVRVEISNDDGDYYVIKKFYTWTEAVLFLSPKIGKRVWDMR